MLIEVFVKFVALDESSVRLLELVAVEIYKDSLEVVDELVDPREV